MARMHGKRGRSGVISTPPKRARTTHAKASGRLKARTRTRTKTKVTNKNHKALETRWGSETFFLRKKKPKGLPAKLASKLMHQTG